MDVRIRYTAMTIAVGGALAAAVALLPAAAAPAHRDVVQPVATGVSVTEACRAAQLDISLGRLGVAAGTSYRTIKFTNVSDRACRLQGYPGVAFVNGHRIKIGYSGVRSGTEHHAVTVRPGHHAEAAVGVSDPANYRKGDCLAHRSRALRVQAPHTRQADVVRYRFTICTTQYARPVVEPVTAP